MNHVPIFKAVFGSEWDHLPSVITQRYANRPFSHDNVTVEGTMDIFISRFARLLSPFLRIAGALVPYAGNNIPVTIHFLSEPSSDHLIFDRIFHFPNKTPYRFRSCMIPSPHSNEVTEFMSIGIGWTACFDATHELSLQLECLNPSVAIN